MDTLEKAKSKHALPALPYAHAALEPHIDARTMQLHHDKHHATYVEKLNAEIEKHPSLRERSAIWLLLNPAKVPEAARAAVRNNAGGHVNHSMFWRTMTPGGSEMPKGALADAIKRDFGGMAKFKTKFEEAGEKHFASGWVWLVAQKDDGKLAVLTTPGHENPVTQGHFPLLVNDVWEHAYYLKHENRRPEYLKAWCAVVNWPEVARRLQKFELSPEGHWQGEGELVLD